MSFLNKGLWAVLAVSLTSCVTSQPEPAALKEPKKVASKDHERVIQQGREVAKRLKLAPGQNPKVVRLEVVPGEIFSFLDVNGMAVIDDMVIGRVNEFVNPDGTINRSAINSLEKRRWPLDIGYTIDYASFPNTIMPGIIKEAIRYWEANTVFRFHEKITDPSDPNFDPTKDLDWVNFTNGDSCSAFVGKHTAPAGATHWGAHNVTLDATGCQRHQAIHEIGHVVGLWHEVTRRDRSEWINVNKQFIKPDRDPTNTYYKYDINFDIQRDAFLISELDFESRMLYANDSFRGEYVRDTDPPVKIDKRKDWVISEKFGPDQNATWDQNFVEMSVLDLETIGEKYGYMVKPYPRNLVKNGTKCMTPSSKIPVGAPETTAGNLISIGSPYAGTAVEVQACPPETMIGTQHKWKIMPDSTFRGLAGKCLGVKDGLDADGTPVVLTLCPRREITARAGSPRIVDREATATSPQVFGRPAIPRRAHVPAEKPKASQVWTFNSADGTIRGLGGKCLTVKAGTAATRSLELRTCGRTITASQKWSVNEVSYLFPRATAAAPTP